MVHFIIDHRKAIEIIFAVLVMISAFCYLFVKVNYDLTKYVPNDVQTAKGLDIMKREFGYPGSAEIMLDNVTLDEAKGYEDKIKAVEGVDTVTGPDTVTDVYMANEFISEDDVKDYYKDGHALISVTFLNDDSSPKTSKALGQIKGHFSGPAVQNKVLNDTITKEVSGVMGYVVFIILAILCLLTTSWFEPILFLAVMGISIIINMGSNIFLGQISFLTSSVAASLQLACAMDYSIFLVHAYSRRRANGEDLIPALKGGWLEAVKSILPGGAATSIGFLALTQMKFSIGYDMGIVLAKGIIISVLTILFLMPALILRFHKLMGRTSLGSRQFH